MSLRLFFIHKISYYLKYYLIIVKIYNKIYVKINGISNVVTKLAHLLFFLKIGAFKYKKSIFKDF